MPRHLIKYIYSGIFAISFFLCLKITIPSLAESADTLDSEIIKKYQKQGQLDDAIAEYKRALEISPDLKEALISLEEAYRLKEKKTKKQGGVGIKKK